MLSLSLAAPTLSSWISYQVMRDIRHDFLRHLIRLSQSPASSPARRRGPCSTRSGNDGQQSVPASLPGVFGVAAGKIKGKYDFCFDAEEAIPFVCRNL